MFSLALSRSVLPVFFFFFSLFFRAKNSSSGDAWELEFSDRLITFLIERFLFVIANNCYQGKLDDLSVGRSIGHIQNIPRASVWLTACFIGGEINWPLMSCVQFVRENNPFTTRFVRWKLLQVIFVWNWSAVNLNFQWERKLATKSQASVSP